MKKSKIFISIIVLFIIFAVLYSVLFQTNISTESIATKVSYYNANKEKSHLESYGRGDINNDGKIDDKDEKLIQEYLNNKTSFSDDQKQLLSMLQ